MFQFLSLYCWLVVARWALSYFCERYAVVTWSSTFLSASCCSGYSSNCSTSWNFFQLEFRWWFDLVCLFFKCFGCFFFYIFRNWEVCIALFSKYILPHNIVSIIIQHSFFSRKLERVHEPHEIMCLKFVMHVQMYFFVSGGKLYCSSNS